MILLFQTTNNYIISKIKIAYYFIFLFLTTKNEKDIQERGFYAIELWIIVILATVWLSIVLINIKSTNIGSILSKSKTPGFTPLCKIVLSKNYDFKLVFYYVVMHQKHLEYFPLSRVVNISFYKKEQDIYCSCKLLKLPYR